GDTVWWQMRERQRSRGLWPEYTGSAAPWSPDQGVSRTKEGQGSRANSGSKMGDTGVVSHHDLTACQQSCQIREREILHSRPGGEGGSVSEMSVGRLFGWSANHQSR